MEASFPVKSVESVRLDDFENNDIIVSSSPLYLNVDQEFLYAAKLTDLLYKRLHYKRLVYLIVREAANFYYSRLKVSDNQIFAKSQMIYLIREARADKPQCTRANSARASLMYGETPIPS